MPPTTGPAVCTTWTHETCQASTLLSHNRDIEASTAGRAPSAPSCASVNRLLLQVPILMPQLLTCSARVLWWRAWPAAGAAGTPAPRSLQPPPMLSSAALPRTACTDRCLAYHIRPGPISRLMHTCMPYRVSSTSSLLLLLPALHSASMLCTGMRMCSCLRTLAQEGPWWCKRFHGVHSGT